MLILTRKKDEKVMIGDSIEISIVDIRGDTIKLGINAPKEVKVYRYEVFQEIQNANKAALDSNLDNHVDLPDLSGE